MSERTKGLSRAEKVAEAQRLAAAGATGIEIARHLGVARSTAYGYLEDPDLIKQRTRRTRYSRPCIDCGGPTDGSGGYKVQRERCMGCAIEFERQDVYWTPERVVDAIRTEASRTGAVPKAADWLWNAPPGCPPVSTIQRVFGSWNAGLEAAGFEPRPTGAPPTVDLPLEEVRERYEAGWSSRALAAEYGCNKVTILHRVRMAGGEVRPPSRPRRVAVLA